MYTGGNEIGSIIYFLQMLFPNVKILKKNLAKTARKKSETGLLIITKMSLWRIIMAYIGGNHAVPLSSCMIPDKPGSLGDMIKFIGKQNPILMHLLSALPIYKIHM